MAAFLRKIRRKLNNSGTTLVELMVTFALLGMLMVQASYVISSITSAYYQIKGNDIGMQVANVVMTKISGQLENARNVVIVSEDYMEPGGEAVTGTLILAGDAAEFRNGNGSHVKLCLEGDEDRKYLSLHYYEVASVNEETGEEEQVYKAVDWKYDSAMYMGYHIRNLQFAMAGTEYDSNVIRVTLELESPQYGEYRTEQLMRCYNLDSLSTIVTYDAD